MISIKNPELDGGFRKKQIYCNPMRAVLGLMTLRVKSRTGERKQEKNHETWR
jgi:hypothetical protein